jgi:hypothetical protein
VVGLRVGETIGSWPRCLRRKIGIESREQGDLRAPLLFDGAQGI